MCTRGDGVPGSVAEALAVLGTALDYLNGPAGDAVDAAALGTVLEDLAGIDSRHAALRLRLIARFDANGCHDSDGYASTGAWLAGKTKMAPGKAKAEARQTRQLAARHPGLATAMAAGVLSASWAGKIAEWLRAFPAGERDGVERMLLEAAAAGLSLDDLYLLFVTARERWRSQDPRPDQDPEDRDFEDRMVQLDLTFGGAGKLNGNLTAEAAAALQAVLEALGKKCGKEDTRTAPQRFHDALQEACGLLIGARMVPDRAGADTHVDAVISMGELLQMDGASVLTDAWLHATAGEHGYLTGAAAQAIACDALIVPVVTGSPDWDKVGQMISVVLHAHEVHGLARPLSAAELEDLRYTLAGLAAGFVSGPGALASVLRTGLLPAPFNTTSLPLDVGVSDRIPDHIRRAVILRDRHCAWPGGCDRRPAQCDVHHTRHKKDGGPTSVTMCGLFCQFHHDICIHRWGWTVELLPDGSMKATSPDGRVIRSHDPPPAEVA